MITKKGFNVFVAVFLIGWLKACYACFSENYTGDVEPVKTGESVFKICHCEKEGYSVQHIKWIDPQGNEIAPFSTNEFETVGRSVDSPKDKLQVVEVTNDEFETGTESKVYTSVFAKEKYVSLNIKSMSQWMSGKYTCETNYEGVKYTKTFNVEARDSLYFVNTNVSQHVVIGEDSLISCEAPGNLDHLITWHLIGETSETQIDNDENYNITSKGLVVKNANADDGGIYRCTATDVTTGELIERKITVEVAAWPHISDFKPDPGSVVLAGTKLTVQCIAEGTPHPDYYWKKIADMRGNPLEHSNTTWRQEVNTMIFDKIQKEDAGTYACEAVNYVGVVKSHITIQVKVPPKITKYDNVEGIEGSIASIVCEATGESAPNIIIVYNENAGLENDPSIIYNQVPIENGTQRTVTFMNVSRRYEGVYACNATNDVDSVVKEINFTVFYKPAFKNEFETVWGWDGKTVNMSCEHDSNPASTIIWKFQGNEIDHHTTTAQQVEANRFIVRLLNNASDHYMAMPVDKNTLYGVYECTAMNKYGMATKYIHLREALPPGPIRNVTDISETATSLTFHIEGPESTDSPPILGYVAQYDTVKNYDITTIHKNRTWSLDRKFTIERLKRNTTYLISFAAMNEAGVGTWSQKYEFRTPETSVPEAPVWDDTPGNLRWKLAEANGIPVDFYIIEYCPFADKVINYSLCTVQKLTTTEFPLHSLETNTTYNFKLRAHNSHGFSEYTEKEITTPGVNLEGLCPAMDVFLADIMKIVFVNAQLSAQENLRALLSAGAIIGIAVVVVFVCLLTMDLILFCWRRQGIIASCYLKRNKKKKDDSIQSRDKKGLLVREPETRPDGGSLTSPNNGHREFEYNKNTGVITGKHSTV